MDNYNIFIERSSDDDKQEKLEYSISKKDILKTIPKNAINISNEQLSKTMTEWRWRIFKFDNFDNNMDTFIEISYKKPNETRKYISANGKWVERDIGIEFDKFVVLNKYAYSNT